MNKEWDIRHNSSTKCRKFVKEALENINTDLCFSVKKKSTIFKGGDEKKVVIKNCDCDNCDDSFNIFLVKKKLEDELGVEVEFE